MNKSTNHLSFLFSKRFTPIFFTQFFGALNDNVFKQILLLLISYGWLQHISDVDLYTNLVALLFILPYFIFSATAGQIADKYERAQLIRYLKFLEIVIMVIATLGIFMGQLWLLLIALFLMGTQSTFFGPIKYAILPEILSEKELISGNALFQAGTSLAILLGMLLGGVLIFFAKEQIWFIGAAIISIAILGYIASIFISKQKTINHTLKIDWNFLRTSFQTLQYAYKIPLIFLILIANSWYWFYGATLLTQIPVMTKLYLHSNETVVSLLLTCFSIGIGIGSFFCQKIGKNKKIHQLIPLIVFGSIGLTLFAFYLTYALNLVTPQSNLRTLNDFLQEPILYHSLIATSLLGVVGGFYIVPLYTMMQHFAPSSYRARVVAANNILNAIFMVASAIAAIIILSLLKLSIPTLFSLLASINLIFAGIVLYHLNKTIKNQLA